MSFIEEASGKSFKERAALMGEKWRSLPTEKKEDYKRKAQEIKDCPLETLTQKEKRDVIMRMARRHQSDVCNINTTYITHD